MLDFFGTIAITMTMVIAINAFITTLASGRVQRMSLAALAGLWIGLCVALGSNGSFANTGPVPLIGVMFATPLLATLAAWFFVPGVRAALLALPTPLLIGLNALRVFGGFFLLLAAAGRLSGPFPYSAGIGDIVTGVLSVPVAIMVARGRTAPALRWNAIGALDLVAAVALGIASSPGFPFQFIHAGVGSAGVQSLPWALIPTVLVPFYLVVHGIIFVQLRSGAPRRQGATGHPVGELA